jgi:hypothetical protein
MTTYRGKIEAGKVVLKDGLKLPDGTEVEVTVMPVQDGRDRSRLAAGQKDPAFTIGDDPVDGLPEDMSVEHDHYLYGTPKRSEREGK